MDCAYSITQLSREFNITTRTIRFYEDKGLLQPQRVGLKRIYNRRDRTRLRLVLRGRRLGWSLNEICTIINLYDSADGEATQLKLMLEKLQDTRTELLQKRADIDASISELKEIEKKCRERMLASKNAPDDRKT